MHPADRALNEPGVTLRCLQGLFKLSEVLIIDGHWTDQPSRPSAREFFQPLSSPSHDGHRATLLRECLAQQGEHAAPADNKIVARHGSIQSLSTHGLSSISQVQAPRDCRST